MYMCVMLGGRELSPPPGMSRVMLCDGIMPISPSFFEGSFCMSAALSMGDIARSSSFEYADCRSQ